MHTIRISSLLIMLSLLSFAPAMSATWHVEVNGTWPAFSGIQDAVEAAAAGDTILIGPGRYDTFVDVVAPAWTEPTIVWITKDNLTFIGAGVGETILGPTSYYDPSGVEPKGMICIDDFHGVVKDLTVENVRTGFWWEYGSFEMIDCSMENCHGGIITLCPGGANISGSFFSNFVDAGYGIGCWFPARDIVIANCSFELTMGSGVSFNSVVNGVVDSCFFESSIGVQATGGTYAHISNCEMSQEVEGGLSISGGNVVLQSNNIYGSYGAMLVSGGGSVTGTNNIFRGGNAEWGTISISGSTAHVSLQGNHIFKESDYAIKTRYFMNEFIELDFTNNFWGTTDPDEIAEWILDVNDDSANHVVVNFLPIADGEVPTESTTLDGLKAMFRDATR